MYSMADKPTFVVTGSRGNLGGKLTAALRDRYSLRCLDVRGGDGAFTADLGSYDESWARQFRGAESVLHFAGAPLPTTPWADAHRGNIVATGNVLRASREHAVRRVIFASSNQIMAGYRFADVLVSTEMPPAPLNPYAVSKLFCEEAGRAFAAETGISFIALRIGNILPAENMPHPGMGIGIWGQQMWLSNRDFLDGVQAAIDVTDVPFAVLNLVSNNPGMRWDLSETKRVLGFFPKDGHVSVASAEDVAEDEVARTARLVPGQWLDQRFQPLRG
jgi:NAD+ dependent glucose-6-phosphate dehydrogenase